MRIDSGIDTAMISVLRQLPRNTRIISAVRHAAISASRSTPLIDASHEERLIGERLDLAAPAADRPAISRQQPP